ncbi:hypothetical protein HK102_012856, partial [Quaeritorhiza haematococci]
MTSSVVCASPTHRRIEKTSGVLRYRSRGGSKALYFAHNIQGDGDIVNVFGGGVNIDIPHTSPIPTTTVGDAFEHANANISGGAGLVDATDASESAGGEISAAVSFKPGFKLDEVISLDDELGNK